MCPAKAVCFIHFFSRIGCSSGVPEQHENESDHSSGGCRIREYIKEKFDMPENDLKDNQMTQEEFDKLQAKYSEMVKVKQKEIADALREARSYGDLSENAEYDAAKENEAKFHEELQALEEKIRNAVVVSIDTTKVGLGLTVTVEDEDLNQEQTFAIVGVDVDPFGNPPKISSSSPIGSALNGKAVGDEVEVQAPSGVRHFRVIRIEESAKED